MPEAVGFFNPVASATRCNDKAGFSEAGGPLFRLGASQQGFGRRLGLLAVALCLLWAATADAAPRTGSRAAARPPKFLITETAVVSDPAVRQELVRLGTAFAHTVTAKTLARFGRKAGHRRVDLLAAPPREYRDRVRADALTRLRAAGFDTGQSQYFVYADRNPAMQLLFLAYYDAPSGQVVLLGADFISSGKLRRGKDSFLTPVGVFENLPDNWGYRAEGTKNDKGWRGLGAKGSRVWDFGFQQAPREFRQGVYDSQMRLLMHATDPDHGEPRLGGPDSKGCVRISSAANGFFDSRSILDRYYEQLAATEPERMWLLRPDRTPVSHPGSYLVVGDSAIQSAARETDAPTTPQ